MTFLTFIEAIALGDGLGSVGGVLNEERLLSAFIVSKMLDVDNKQKGNLRHEGRKLQMLFLLGEIVQ